tara:strand:- start:6002 stop:6649 length:648 start_codon:yes stop_codon:yes gene_type:complete
MSVKHITEVVQLEGISPTQKLILFILANYADEFGQSYPSHARIMKISCLSRNAVITNLNTLRDLGYIEWENRNDTSNLYTLVFSEGGTSEVQGGTVKVHNTKTYTKQVYILNYHEIFDIYKDKCDQKYFVHSANPYVIRNNWNKLKEEARRGLVSPKTGKKLDLTTREFWKSYFDIANNSQYYRKRLNGYMKGKPTCRTLLSLTQFNAIIERKHG